MQLEGDAVRKVTRSPSSHHRPVESDRVPTFVGIDPERKVGRDEEVAPVDLGKPDGYAQSIEASATHADGGEPDPFQTSRGGITAVHRQVLCAFLSQKTLGSIDIRGLEQRRNVISGEGTELNHYADPCWQTRRACGLA